VILVFALLAYCFRHFCFDFCYFHFRSSKESGTIDIEKSCQVLWSYLASWGMLRGSSFLLWKNPAYLKDLVEWIYEQPLSSWDIDVDDYKESSQTVLDLYKIYTNTLNIVLFLV